MFFFHLTSKKDQGEQNNAMFRCKLDYKSSRSGRAEKKKKVMQNVLYFSRIQTECKRLKEVVNQNADKTYLEEM